MNHDQWEAQRFRHLIAGTALVLAGSVFAANAAPGFVALIGAVLIMRYCWIEENIHADLLHSRTVPVSYRNAQRRQNRLLARILAHHRPEVTCPRLLASHLRMQSLGCAAFVYGLLASAVALHGGASLWLLSFASALSLVIGLRRAEDFAEARHAVSDGRPLPRHKIATVHAAESWLVNRLPDRHDR